MITYNKITDKTCFVHKLQRFHLTVIAPVIHEQDRKSQNYSNYRSITCVKITSLDNYKK